MKNKRTKIYIFIISLAFLSYTLYSAFFMGFFSPKSFKVNGFTIHAPKTSFLFGVAEGGDEGREQYLLPFSEYKIELTDKKQFFTAVFIEKKESLFSSKGEQIVSLGVSISYSRDEDRYVQIDKSKKSENVVYVQNSSCNVYIVSFPKDRTSVYIFQRKDRHITGFIDSDRDNATAEKALLVFCPNKKDTREKE